MCTLAVYHRAWSSCPIVIAANRDEFLSRPASPPGLLDPRHHIFGGRDAIAGGTWLAVNAHGMAAALLNRRTDDPIDPALRSRGLLCIESLRHRDADASRSWILDEDPKAYNPFNLLVVDARHAWVATNHAGRLSVQNLPEGLHLLTNLDVNDSTCPRISASVQLFQRLLIGGPSPCTPAFVDQLQTILASHDTELDPRLGVSGNSLCVHADNYGTRSSTLAFLNREGRWTILHTDSPPCRGTYKRYPVSWNDHGVS